MKIPKPALLAISTAILALGSVLLNGNPQSEKSNSDTLKNTWGQQVYAEADLKEYTLTKEQFIWGTEISIKDGSGNLVGTRYSPHSLGNL